MDPTRAFEPIEFLEKLAAIVPRPAGAPGPWTWAALMRRLLDLDVLAYPRCGGRLRRIATAEDPAVVSTILVHLGLLHPAHSPGPAPPSAALRPAAPAPPSRQ